MATSLMGGRKQIKGAKLAFFWDVRRRLTKFWCHNQSPPHTIRFRENISSLAAFITSSVALLIFNFAIESLMKSGRNILAALLLAVSGLLWRGQSCRRRAGRSLCSRILFGLPDQRESRGAAGGSVFCGISARRDHRSFCHVRAGYWLANQDKPTQVDLTASGRRQAVFRQAHLHSVDHRQSS